MGDIRDIAALRAVFRDAAPEVVFHLAAQPIVRMGYRSPVDTFEVNVMGTVNLLECVRESDTVRVLVNVTTDKVYENDEREQGYRESDRLDGADPYSNSKSCSELVTHCYTRSFLRDAGVAVSTVRAGNVIGGGDFAPERLLPDCVRAIRERRTLYLRDGSSVRPYQHVLEALFAYLMIGARTAVDPSLAGAYNVGPAPKDQLTTTELVSLFAAYFGEGFSFAQGHNDGPREAKVLRLDCTKIRDVLGIIPRTDAARAVEWTVEWTKRYLSGGEILSVMDAQIDRFLEK
jgi:CDP-glucose 4,6-dehydratase